MKSIIKLLFVAALLGAYSCSSLRKADRTKSDDGKLELVFVQVNDVYEIAPLEGGASGGMARVATLKKQFRHSNPNTVLVMAGDFLSPSIYNSLPYDGKAVRGKQMIEAMNSAGMDLAIFGNHEFDIKENELQERINESTFDWVSSNTFHLKDGKIIPFEKVQNNVHTWLPVTYIKNFMDADGTMVRIGFIGLTLPFNKPGYVTYTDALSTAKKLYAELKDSVDAVVAITHQAVNDDSVLAAELPGLAVILGGHEHSMRFLKVGNVYITKAHANAKSAFVVKMNITKGNKQVEVTPELKMLDPSVPLDSTTNAVVKKWMDISSENFARLGFDAKQVVINKGEPLDGREYSVRNGSTGLTRLIADAIADACPEAQVVIYNAGSIRVDDILLPPVTQYDIIRSLPYGGQIREADMKGKLLIQVLDAGRKNLDVGGYLQYSPVVYDSSANKWMIGNAAIDPEKTYRVAMNDFLFTGNEANMSFLSKDNPDVTKVYPAETSPGNSKSDIRLAVVRYLHKKAM